MDTELMIHNYVITPKYKWSLDGDGLNLNVLNGFEVVQRLGLKTILVDKAGEITDQAILSGVNEIQNMKYFLKDDELLNL